MNNKNLLAIIATLSGLLLIFIGFSLLPVSPESLHVPKWLISVMGTMFVVAGISAFGKGSFSQRTLDVLGAFVLVGFSLVALWIAFGPGSRTFGGATPVLGRVVFGIGANFCVLLTVWAIKRSLTQKQNPVPEERNTLPLWTVGLFVAAIILQTIILTLYTNPDGSLRLWQSVPPAVIQIFNHERPNLLPPPLHNPELDPEAPNKQIMAKDVSAYEVQKIWDFEFKHPRALAIDANDNVYVSETYQGEGTNSRILKFDSEGTLLGWWGKGSLTSGWHSATSTEEPAGNGNNPGEFNYIFRITFDQNGYMYVIDRGKYYDASGSEHVSGFDRIQKFHSDGSYMTQLDNEHIGWSEDNLSPIGLRMTQFLLDEPSCIIVTENELVIGSWAKNRVDKFDLLTGVPVEWLGKSDEGNYGWHKNGESISAPYWGTEIGAFNGVIDCEVYDGNLYVVSYASNPVIAIFDYKTGSYLKGVSHNDGHKPQEIIVDKLGNLIFSDNYEGSIKFMDQALTPQYKIQLGPGGNYFGVGDFAINSKGTLFFIEQQKQKLYEMQMKY